MSLPLSLSVRIAEAPSKTELRIPFTDLVDLAAESGYAAICMRASAGGVQSTPDRLAEMKHYVDRVGLAVSMVTADFDVPLNNKRGPLSLRDIVPSLDVAETFGCDLIRVCMKEQDDISHARRAADMAAERGIRLAHQCHIASLFEEVDRILEALRSIGRPNFGLIYEPANLMMCGQPYGPETLGKLAPFIMNVYVQNHRIAEDGPESTLTWCLGRRRYHNIELWDEGGVDFEQVFRGLETIGYQGYFTIHQARGIETSADALRYASRCAEMVHAAGA